MIITAVDTDLNGGIACIDLLTEAIVLLREMPVTDGPEGQQVDARELNKVFDRCAAMGSLTCVVERAIVKPQTSAKGVHMTKGVGTIHQTYGAVRALAELRFAHVAFAWPSSWKKAMGLTRDKDLSLDLAAKLHPAHAPVFIKKKRHGVAEAVLLAHWYNRTRKEKCT